MGGKDIKLYKLFKYIFIMIYIYDDIILL